jgi:tight adherence protein C
VRGATRDATLNQRIATLTLPSPDVMADTERNEPAEWRWLETMLLCAGKDRDEVSQALRAADITHPFAIVIFAALRFGLTLLAGVAVAVYMTETGRLTGLGRMMPFAASAAVYLAAKMVLRSRITARRRRIGKELPFALDIILLMLESGVSLDQCFRHLAQWDAPAVPTIQRILAVLVGDLQKGMSYEAGLDRWAARMNVTGAKELALLFRQSILHGTELAPALRAFNKEFSEKRISTAREVIGKKTTQMTVVMIFFLMPALMIVIAGPATVAVIGALKAFN